MCRAFSGLRIWMVLLAGVSSAWAQANKADRPRNIILIGWDGAQREHVKECLAKGELPALKALAAEGTMVDIDIRGTTDTKAGWSQILTGYDPDVTGVYSNIRYQPVPAGLSVFERLEEHFGPDKIVTVAVIGKKGHCGEIDPPKKVKLTDEEAGKVEAVMKIPLKNRSRRDRMDDQEWAALQAARKGKFEPEPGSNIVEEDGAKYLVTPGKPYLNMSKVCDVWEFGLMQDQKVGMRALELLDKYKDKPFLFFVHFAEVDHKGHSFGENSKEYNDALISNDKWTGKILEKLEESGLYDKTLVYVTADHGFDEGLMRHNKAPHVFLTTNDKGVMRNGDRADITPTILNRFGIDLRKLSRKSVTATQPDAKDPPLAGHPLTQPLPEWKVKKRAAGRATSRPAATRAK
ncbi:MAG TPA: alkaline phosphatase family protein [Phycisphaerae bacterium]|nr:alkaline phosphatase family protein [Phycisphaerae bacterium]